MTTEVLVTPEESAEGTEASGEAVKKVTVGDLGLRLPIGTGPMDGSSARSTALAFRDWTGRDDRKIGKMRQKNRAASDAEIVEMILAEFTTRWGSHDFTAMKHVERCNVLAMAPSPDIFHAWSILRVENLGPECEMVFECPKCEKEIVYGIDIEEISEKVPVSPSADLTDQVEIKRGIAYNGEKRFEGTLAPIRWKTYRKINDSARMDISELKLIVIEGGVVGLKGVDGQVVLAETNVDTLQKLDIELLSREIERRTLGPDLSIDIKCPHCDLRIVRPVDWEYDVFFSVRGTTS